MQVGNGGQMVLHAWVAVAAGRMAPLKKLGEAPCSRSLEAQERMLLDRPRKEGRGQHGLVIQGSTLSLSKECVLVGHHKSSGSQQCGPRPAASVLPANSWERQLLRLHSRPAE